MKKKKKKTPKWQNQMAIEDVSHHIEANGRGKVHGTKNRWQTRREKNGELVSHQWISERNIFLKRMHFFFTLFACSCTGFCDFDHFHRGQKSDATFCCALPSTSTQPFNVIMHENLYTYAQLTLFFIDIWFRPYCIMSAYRETAAPAAAAVFHSVSHTYPFMPLCFCRISQHRNDQCHHCIKYCVTVIANI